MRKKILFVTRLLMGVSFGSLLMSPICAMDEQEKRPAAAAVPAKLNQEQDKFMRDVHALVRLGIRLPLHDFVGPFQALSNEPTEDAFKEWLDMCWGEQINEGYTKINKAVDSDFSEIQKYYKANQARIGASIDGEAYLNSLKAKLQETLSGFLTKVDDFLKVPSQAKTKNLALEAENLKAPLEAVMGQFHISDHTKTLNAYLYGVKEMTAEEKAAQQFKALQLEAAQKEAERLKELERLLAPHRQALAPLTARIEALVAPVAGGRDRDGYSVANEGIMRVGNEGGLALLEQLRRLLPPLVALQKIAYIEPREGAALGFSKEHAVAFYKTLVLGNHINISGMIVESFTEMMTSPAYDNAALLRLCRDKSEGTFEGIYARYMNSKTPQNQHDLAEAILKLGVVDGHSTRLLHPLALVKSLWDQNPDLRPALLEFLPQYFTFMADQVGKCAAGATGRTILMTRLLAEALTKTPLK
ncbi:MAG: hypothetical protein JSS34_06850 [Proteobacteria bacterium]|nr:hypothetical protein [Pseudomonadota bacterium]